MTRLVRKQRRVPLCLQPVQLQRQIRQLSTFAAFLAHPSPHRCQTNSSPIEKLLYIDRAPLQLIHRASSVRRTARAPRNPEPLRRKLHRRCPKHNPGGHRNRHHRIKIKRSHRVWPRKHMRPNAPHQQKRAKKTQRETYNPGNHWHAVVRKHLHLLHDSPKWPEVDRSAPQRPNSPNDAPKRLAWTR